MIWKELVFETQAEGQISFIKPSDFPDIPDNINTCVFLDGRKLSNKSYMIECEGALVTVCADLPEDALVEIRYLIKD